jgi:diguanylate cyclase (GGDEF)-like protein/PAS domain S-box-containing protein
VQARIPLAHEGVTRGTVGQVFDVTLPRFEASEFHDLLDAALSRYDKDSLLIGLLVAVIAILAAAALIIAFAFRQSRAMRYLATSAERLGEGRYEEFIGLNRRDEVGRLAQSFDRLRQRLRTTTITRDYLDKVLGSMSEALLLANPDGRITRVNEAAARLLGRGKTELLGQSVTELVAPRDREQFRLVDSGEHAQEYAFLNRSGQEVPVSCTISAIQDENPQFRGFIIAARNITERKIAEQRIRYLARIDALTKVPNRMQFQHLLQRTIARASRGGRRLALLYLDIDRFKDINDIYGHTAGDVCLEALTERLTRQLHEGTTVGRFAGDEFGIILEGIESHGEPAAWIAHTCRVILREIAKPVGFHGQQIFMTASIGIAIYPLDAQNVIDLIRNADAALYHAKRGGGDRFELYDPEMNATAVERLMLKSRLRRAYEQNELLLHYQPKVDLRTGRVAGAEALVRWDLSERGIVLPSEFIPLAEESNLILDIGEWVLDRVCRDFRTWQEQMLFPGKVSVNLSLKQLRQPNFSQRVGQIFRRYGVPPASLELEVTETTLMEDPERTVRILDELYAMGLSLAIDDFGTGYSSLSALQKFPISTLKIDQSFVRDAASDPGDATIVSTIIQMGHSLDLDVIAEGVESERQLHFLRGTECDYVQGLLFGSPMTPEDFIELLVSQRGGMPAYGGFFAPSSA